jgi:uncharacterized phosphosugar-binding protein
MVKGGFVVVMKAYEEYHKIITELMNAIVRDEKESLAKAANIMADTIQNDKLIYVFGTGGHSYICAEEMFYRAGGLVPVCPILDPGVSIAFGAARSTWIERLPGYSQRVLKSYGVGKGDTLIVANAYGINSSTIDAAIEGKRLGAKVIAITSPTFSKQVPPDHPARHPSSHNLCDLDEVDVVIDNHMPVGDAIVELKGLNGEKVGPSSTMVNAFTINSLVLSAMETMVERGMTPPIWVSANMPGGDEANARYLREYGPRIKHL